MRKILAMLLVVPLLLGMCAQAAELAVTETAAVEQTAAAPVRLYSESYEYLLYAYGTAEIIDHYGSVRKLVIPETLGGHRVTSIGDGAFYGCEKLTSIIIPDSVTSIDAYAFSGCAGIVSIIIPEGVTNIGEGAFSLCENLMLTVAPDSFAQEYAMTSGIPFTYTDEILYSWLND